MALTPKQQRFVEEYLTDLNATQAAIRAGYSKRSANVTGARLLTNDSVSHAIAEAQAKRSARVEIDQDWVLRNLQAVFERCMEAEPVMTFDREERRMVQAVDGQGRSVWQFDSTGANRALELIGKHLGMFTDRLRLSGDVGVKIIDDIE